MSLEDWLTYGWLARHEVDADEIADWLEAIDRDIEKAALPLLGPDWRLNIAHNAAVLVAQTALAACGYRAMRGSHRHVVLESLEHTLGIDRPTLDELSALRKKRAFASYERAGAVSDAEADTMLDLARQLRERLLGWMRAAHPELLRK